MTTSDFPSLQDFTPKSLIQAAQDHYEIALDVALSSQPTFRRKGGVREMLSGVMNPFGNMVFGNDVPNAESYIEDVTARLKQSGAPAFWWVGPNTKPTNLGELLLQKGWSEPAALPAMMIDLTTMPHPSTPEGMELRIVESQEDLEIWQGALAAGYGLPLEVAQLFGLLDPNVALYYTAFLDDQAVATSAVFFHGGIAGIYCVATVSEFRGRGLGAAVTALPLIEARKQGYRTGTLQASQMGHPVYKRLGFYDVAEVNIFTFGAPAST
ncbi:MAG: GNAT family N-acetyltransferase [Armatimonadetes bacterium]|nr:GNAT family N-acetyltransferase [Armatimonadota bacterium]